MQEEALQLQITTYEKPLQKLIGKSIMNVFYYEINYGKPTWNQDKFHSLDYGVELQMSDDTSYYFIWDSIYHQYDLKFSTGSIVSEFKMNADIQKKSCKRKFVLGKTCFTENQKH
ncbi:hypothetical protein [uncultured Dokdonia sp.]|uniref:hypothetical protein n=1 Tax=uncultured Dokdonia sp. TaxID=575653 RepID=UPI00260B5AE6|nr:hypothetical protein [uncultured Dokdonia sp.]